MAFLTMPDVFICGISLESGTITCCWGAKTRKKKITFHENDAVGPKKHPSQNNLEKTLHKHQLGFRTKRATEQLLTLLSFTVKAIHNNSSERWYGYVGFTDLISTASVWSTLILCKAKFKIYFWNERYIRNFYNFFSWHSDPSSPKTSTNSD